MAERGGLFLPETVASGVLSPQEISLIQCVVLGWTNREYEKLDSGDAKYLRNCIAEKMMGDTSFEERLMRLSRLPFVPENHLTPMEGRVAFLTEAGFRRCEIARMMDMDPSNVSHYKKRIQGKKDRGVEVPPIEYGLSVNRFGMIRGIHYAVSEGLIDTTLLKLEPEKPLSLNESRTMLMLCYGLSKSEIAAATKQSEGTVKTYCNRIRGKLGVGREYQIISAGIVEIVRLTS